MSHTRHEKHVFILNPNNNGGPETLRKLANELDEWLIKSKAKHES